MLAAAAASSSGFVLAPAFVDGSFSAPDDESDEGPPVQQSFARRGSALLGAIGRRFSGQVEMGVGVV